MNSVKTMKFDDLKKRRDLMNNAEEFALDPIDKMVFEVTVDALDREIDKRLCRRNVVIGLIVGAIVLIAIFIWGCEATAGLGRDITWMGEAGQEMLEHGHEAMNK